MEWKINFRKLTLTFPISFLPTPNPRAASQNQYTKAYRAASWCLRIFLHKFSHVEKVSCHTNNDMEMKAGKDQSSLFKSIALLIFTPQLMFMWLALFLRHWNLTLIIFTYRTPVHPNFIKFIDLFLQFDDFNAFHFLAFSISNFLHVTICDKPATQFDIHFHQQSFWYKNALFSVIHPLLRSPEYALYDGQTNRKKYSQVNSLNEKRYT